MGKEMNSHPDQSSFPDDMSPAVRYESYSLEELESLIQEIDAKMDRGEDLSEYYYKPIEEYY